ncbi:hypothetical protein TNCV_4129821 [Trichonephila clavipes]|nr:hypothetical protein TNCV_4129821 [Trichonephila clavipes]
MSLEGETFVENDAQVFYIIVPSNGATEESEWLEFVSEGVVGVVEKDHFVNEVVVPESIKCLFDVEEQSSCCLAVVETVDDFVGYSEELVTG